MNSKLMREFNFQLLSEKVKSKLNYGDSVRAIAPTIGVSHSTLSRIISGKSADMNTIVRVCDWLDLPITNFIVKSK